MDKTEKLSKSEEFILKIEIQEQSSELIMKLEKIIKEDLTSQKLPTDFINPLKSSEDK